MNVLSYFAVPAGRGIGLPIVMPLSPLNTRLRFGGDEGTFVRTTCKGVVVVRGSTMIGYLPIGTASFSAEK